MRWLAVAFLVLAGCGGELGEDLPVAAPPAPPPECGYYPEAGDTITWCVSDDGQMVFHGDMPCVRGRDHGDTWGLQCNYNCTGADGCKISRDALWAVADCGSC